MPKHIHTGKLGEQLAAAYFLQQGFQILEQNWRHGHWEVDIIACKNDILYFIEVKARRSQKYGLPEESVSRKKMENLALAAEQYLYQHPQWKRIQFDILAISLSANNNPEYFHIRDVSV
ncbi:MAG TPA: YraN family protein [Ferruginibacter sp.]|nr:YraN family protein [Ferruginibacter sp.]HMP20255.1 YraN family protein [Ferruginibacter sp.]